MGKSKNRKGHKEKVAKRKELMLQEKRKYQKFQHDMLMRMINAEKENGSFDNNQQMPSIPGITDINIPADVQGPQI